MAQVNTAPLWDAFKTHGCDQARTALIEAHLPLVDLTRKRVVPRVPERLDVEDLRSEGQIAVVRAVDKFDPQRGVKFTSFCISMIRGALLEYLRREDWVPRSVRTQQKTLVSAADSLVHALGREPEDAELAEALGLDTEALRALQGQAAVRTVISLDALINHGQPDGDLDPLVIGEQIADPAPGPEALALLDNQSELLWQVVRWLPETERALVRAHYDEGLTLKAIAARLDRSESRVHQYQQQALGRLRIFLGVKEETMVETMTNGAVAVVEAPDWDGWTAAEDETLRELWGRREPTELGRKLGRTAAMVSQRARELQLGALATVTPAANGDPRPTWWNEAADAILRQQWGQQTPAEIGLALGRGAKSVRRRAAVLELAGSRELPASPRRIWTPAEDERLRAMHGHASRREIARELNRTPQSISCRIAALQLNAERGVVPGRPIVAVAPPAVTEMPPPSTLSARVSLIDAELLAMAEVYRLLVGLDERARARVVRWVADRWEAGSP